MILYKVKFVSLIYFMDWGVVCFSRVLGRYGRKKGRKGLDNGYCRRRGWGRVGIGLGGRR